ncbi:hypothetical protein AKJ16_DCAP11276 [Drosera capensis]
MDNDGGRDGSSERDGKQHEEKKPKMTDDNQPPISLSLLFTSPFISVLHLPLLCLFLFPFHSIFFLQEDLLIEFAAGTARLLLWETCLAWPALLLLPGPFSGPPCPWSLRSYKFILVTSEELLVAVVHKGD